MNLKTKNKKPHLKKMSPKMCSFPSCSDSIPFTAPDWTHQRLFLCSVSVCTKQLAESFIGPPTLE